MPLRSCISQWNDPRFKVGSRYEVVREFTQNEEVIINPFDPVNCRVEIWPIKKLVVKVGEELITVKADYFSSWTWPTTEANKGSGNIIKSTNNEQSGKLEAFK